MKKIELKKGTKIVAFPENQIDYMKKAGWLEVEAPAPEPPPIVETAATPAATTKNTTTAKTDAEAKK